MFHARDFEDEVDTGVCHMGKLSSSYEALKKHEERWRKKKNWGNRGQRKEMEERKDVVNGTMRFCRGDTGNF